MAAKKILVIAINPKDTGRLRLDEELRQIKKALKLSDDGEQFEVLSEGAVRAGDLHRHLLNHKPQIVHFSGHGVGAKGLVAEDKTGKTRLVSTATLERLFRLCGGIECVVMNACYSVAQMDAIAKHVQYVIGMNQAIGDAAAIRFAEGFYDGLGYGRSCAEAFEFGLLAIEEEGIAEAMTPVLRVGDSASRQGFGYARPMGDGGKGNDEKGEGEKGKGEEEKGEREKGKGGISGAAKRVFISYKRDVRPDEPVAVAVYESLGRQHEVFIDQSMPVGTRWAEQIEAELRRTDVLIVLLSAMSVGSEMVQQEVALAHEIAEDNGGVPQILPVRLGYRQPFQYPLSVYLDPINWAVWDGEADTARLIAELDRAIAGGRLSVGSLAQKQAVLLPLDEGAGERGARKVIPVPFPAAQPQSFGPSTQPLSTSPLSTQPLSTQPLAAPQGAQAAAESDTKAAAQPLEFPEGTMELESGFYVERPEDGVALEAILRPGVTITIKGPRQMGKSSLLNRVMGQASEAGKQVAFLDFQLFDRAALQDADEFYQQFCFWLTDELELDDCFEDYWNKPLGHTQRCTRYVGRHILKSLDAPLVLAMDEVERIFDTPFRNDFFSMLRSWHNQRATKKVWKRLDLALVTSTEPYQLIADLNQSPFNVGQVLALQDFTAAQVYALNERHGEPLMAGQVQQLMGLLGGHPYLVRRALYLVASGQWQAATLFAQATNEDGPFGAHLRNHLFRLASSPELVQGLLKILRSEVCPEEQIYFRLHGAGLVCRQGQRVFARNQLYANYFSEYLKG